MTKLQLIKYAETKGYKFNGEKGRNDLYIAEKENGEVITAVSLKAMKRLIDIYGGDKMLFKKGDKVVKANGEKWAYGDYRIIKGVHHEKFYILAYEDSTEKLTSYTNETLIKYGDE